MSDRLIGRQGSERSTRLRVVDPAEPAVPRPFDRPACVYRGTPHLFGVPQTPSATPTTWEQAEPVARVGASGVAAALDCTSVRAAGERHLAVVGGWLPMTTGATVISIEDRIRAANENRPAGPRAATDGSRGPATGRLGSGSGLGVVMPSLLPSRATFTGRGTGDLGSLTHGLIGSHVQFVSGPQVPGDLLERMYAVAYAVIDANPNAARVLATEAASLAVRYLHDFLPRPPWRLLGVEYQTGDGPVDLAWQHEETGEVLFDEVKTSRVSHRDRVSVAWVNQARRYSAAGTARFGTGFLGTRLVPLGPSPVVRLVRHAQPTISLSPTTTQPLRAVAATGGQRS